MKVAMKYFGEVEVEEKEIVHFSQGLPGFRHINEFILLPLPDAPMYSVLQAVGEKETAFVTANPYLFFKDYEFDIDENSKAELQLETPEDVELYCVLTVRDPFRESTINLQAPVVINKRTNQAKQLILNSSWYHTKHGIADQKAGDEHVNP
ncbi:flagellar assembly protein FliW [Salimicrobium album]|uniref:Flagellar assembly factor FliW n=1 Tax=Salimicrobium album TaxID=50717 RepID=A0A1H3G333_9BACI|nr:flagellar assembly protein FliW [Salimicrobium album]SDX97520.1 flagellar assembly factor FliW [Salimicrobium album]